MPFSSLENERDIHYDYAGFRSRSLKYIDSTILPASRSVDFPHIINTAPVFNEETNPTNLRLCDDIATILFRADPNLLTKLLDCEVPEFFFLREKNRTSLEDMFIFRKNRTVTCAFFNHINDCLDYDTRIVSTIHEDGRWEATAVDGASMQFMPRPISPVEITKSGMRMAQSMIIMKKWAAHESVTMSINKPQWWDTVNHHGYGDQRAAFSFQTSFG